MDDTEYLLGSENNAKRLKGNIKQTDNLLNNKTTDVTTLAGTIVDSDSVLSLMENMSIGELKVLKASCELLIGFKSNS